MTSGGGNKVKALEGEGVGQTMEVLAGLEGLWFYSESRNTWEDFEKSDII